MFGAAIGTSTTTSYIESAAGVAAGGRTGLTVVVVAILFLVFDIEAAFMYPWAILYNQLSHVAGQIGVSVFGFVEMLVFVAILVVALAYVWRKKAIGWD